MAMKYKRAMGPLDETAKARLWASSGTLCGAGTGEGWPELEDLVESFYGEDGEGKEEDEREMRRGGGDVKAALGAVLAEAAADLVAVQIRAEVKRGLREVGFDKEKVMAWLRIKGFHAGLCLSKWNRSSGGVDGYHKYVDVISCNGSRYIVEIDILREFKIARPTSEYIDLRATLPRVFVGQESVLKQVVELMCMAMKNSMRRVEMHVPPWRQREYVQEKWFSSYSRSIDNIIGDTKYEPGYRHTVNNSESLPMDYSNKKFCWFGITRSNELRTEKIPIVLIGN